MPSAVHDLAPRVCAYISNVHTICCPHNVYKPSVLGYSNIMFDTNQVMAWIRRPVSTVNKAWRKCLPVTITSRIL